MADGSIRFKNVAAASIPTPATGTVSVYVDSADKHTKQKDDAGVTTDLTTGGGGGGTYIIERFTLSAGDITNKFVQLSGDMTVANDTLFFVASLGSMTITADYTADAALDRAGWSGTTLDGVLVAGDVVTVQFQ